MNSDHFVNPGRVSHQTNFLSLLSSPIWSPGVLLPVFCLFACFALFLVSALSILDNGFFKFGISESRGWGCLTLAFLVCCLQYHRAQLYPTPNIMDDYSPYICITKKGYSMICSRKKKMTFSLYPYERADRASYQTNKSNLYFSRYPDTSMCPIEIITFSPTICFFDYTHQIYIYIYYLSIYIYIYYLYLQFQPQMWESF